MTGPRARAWPKSDAIALMDALKIERATLVGAPAITFRRKRPRPFADAVLEVAASR